jgi:hypothetical protein
MTAENPGRDGTVAEPGQGVQDEFDWEETPPSTAVVEVVSRALNVEPTAVEPLYDVVDPDALDRLVDTDAADRSRSATRTEFAYEGLRVTVESVGRVAVHGETHSR